MRCNNCDARLNSKSWVRGKIGVFEIELDEEICSECAAFLIMLFSIVDDAETNSTGEAYIDSKFDALNKVLSEYGFEIEEDLTSSEVVDRFLDTIKEV